MTSEKQLVGVVASSSGKIAPSQGVSASCVVMLEPFQLTFCCEQKE